MCINNNPVSILFHVYMHGFRIALPNMADRNCQCHGCIGTQMIWVLLSGLAQGMTGLWNLVREGITRSCGRSGTLSGDSCGDRDFRGRDLRACTHASTALNSCASVHLSSLMLMDRLVLCSCRWAEFEDVT